MSRPRLSNRFWTLLVVLLCGARGPVAAAQATLTLFNGTSLLGWSPHGTWTATGGILATAGGGNREVLTAVPFADLRLDFDFNESTAMGAKLRLWANRENSGGLTIDLDTTGSSAGVGGIESLSHSSLATVAGGWHHVQVEASHGQLNIRVDGQPSGSASALGTRAGYLGFAATGDGTLQLRNLKLSPLNLTGLYNGSDLSGWKTVARGPDAKGGMGHSLTKTFTLGMGGGSTKPHEAKWVVQGGAIHGENGPGGLENSTVVGDGIFQLNAFMRGEAKKENFVALSVRNTAGQLGGGYAVGIGPFSGSVEGVVSKPPMVGAGPVDETVIVAGRTIALWINGTLSTVHTDTRAENSSTAQGAKMGGGTITLVLPNSNEQLEVQRLNEFTLPATYGVPARAPAPPPAPVQSTAPAVAPTAVTAPSVAEKALIQEQQTAAQKDQADKQSKQRVASLMGQALATNDPQQQMSAYGQVVQIDPSNAAAVQGFKEAQAKVQAAQTAQQQAATAEANQQQQAQTRDEQTSDSLTKSKAAFLAGHLGEASAALSVAERLAPGNPIARDLRLRINSAQSLRNRLYMLGSGAGLIGLLSLTAIWLRRRKQQRFPVLEVTRGFEEGRAFPIDKDLVRIGAVTQNGGQKNDIVIQDIEHAISRFHCEVARKNGQLYITDLKSSNGTRLNGETLQPGRPELLRKGSTITLANNVDLRFGYDRRATRNA